MSDQHTNGRHTSGRHASVNPGHLGVSDRHIHYRLARYRSHRGLTQQQVADQAGITREYVSMIENGRRRADSHRLLSALAAALRVDVTALTACHPDAVNDPPEHAVTLRLALPDLTATVEATPGGRGIVITDGVWRVELTPGPDEAAKQTRNGMLRIVNAVCAYLRGTPPGSKPDPGGGEPDPDEQAGQADPPGPTPPAETMNYPDAESATTTMGRSVRDEGTHRVGLFVWVSLW